MIYLSPGYWILEAISIILSSFLLIYGIRTFIFLYKSWKYHLNSLQIIHESPPVSTLKSLFEQKVYQLPDTRGENLILHDIEKNYALETNKTFNNYRIIHDEFSKNSNHIELSIQSSNHDSNPVISLIVATNNEESVIEGLLKSIEKLTYNRDRFEVIIVDDSTDSTSAILEEWTKRVENLKVIRRNKRIGWKGGALNLALECFRKDSSWAIILDADTVLPPNIIENFLTAVFNCKETCNAIQGYCIPYNNRLYSNSEVRNWVSKGVEFRLAQRNMVEFVAKDSLGLPLQITGNLFMIKSSIIKEIGFSTDLCEDWELTLQLYLRQCNKNNLQSGLHKQVILFRENINATSQIPTSISSYFKQRLRVSEGHTRGFIKMVPRLIKYNQPIKNKIEIFLTGFRYLIFVFILSLVLLDINTANLLSMNIFSIYSISFSIQLFCLLAFVATNLLAINICNKSREYDLTFILSKFILDFCIFPALVIGPLLGLIRNRGTFYRTQRVNSNIKNLSFI